MSARFSFYYFSSCYLCLLLVVALFHLCSSNQNSDHVLCMDEERHALLEFKHGLIDNADRLASWVGDDTDCCRWAGIVCDNVTGHVHRIHLPGVNGHCHDDYSTTKEYLEALKQRLRGNISSSLLHLMQLTHLDLSCNDFGGIQVPNFIGSLGNLRHLNLSQSKFGGIIPPQLGNLSKLHVLSLGSFHDDYVESTTMTNMQWLSNFRLLNHLDLSNVDLSKAFNWFRVINTLPSLVELHLSDCQLSHIHPRVPSLNITSLSLLDLSGNSFENSSVPWWIFSLTSLVSLDLSWCNFYGPIPGIADSFRNLTSLELLHVSGNTFMSSSLVLKGLSSVGGTLISLDISSCGVSSSVLDDLHNLTSLLHLDLSQNQITKTIPKALGNICNLREINLSDMDFSNITLTYLFKSFFDCKSPRLELLSLLSSNISGDLPDQLGQFRHMVHLLLDDNYISGTIPTSIGQLSLMRTLILSKNLISGLIPFSIGRLSLLEVFDLSYNQLNGSLPSSLGQLSKLHDLDISYNLLTGVVTEAHFTKLASLKHLSGTNNNLAFRPQVANWIPPFRLQSLYLNSWNLGPQFPLWLQLQSDLIYLDIGNTNISSPMPESFWGLFPNVVYLDMSRNSIQGTLSSIPATIDILDLSSNEFKGKLPAFSNRSSQNFLDLSNNLFVGSLNRMLCTYGVKGMIVLNFGNNNLSGVIPECWEKWPNLSFLNLESNNLFGGIPRTLGSLPYLQSLNMRGNKLSGRLPASLKNLTNLLILQLGKNEFVGSIPSWFGREVSLLRILNLRSNHFDGNITDGLCHLSAIQILDLADNNLSGNIPRCFNNFSALSGKVSTSYDEFLFYSRSDIDILGSDSLVMKGREDTYSTNLRLVMLLDFSSNNFSGFIPSELTTLTMLKSLNLSRNQLTGRIPENMGNMKLLESFDVSLNKLSGELPMSLSKLSFLSSFNVSYNSLKGRVPSSTQLQTFNESSFFGNQLCGDPLIKRCNVQEPNNKDHEEEDVTHGSDWGFIISMVLGFVPGFWIVVGPLIVSRSSRIAYFRFLSKLRYMVYDVMHKYCCKISRK